MHKNSSHVNILACKLYIFDGNQPWGVWHQVELSTGKSGVGILTYWVSGWSKMATFGII